jgi:hypothetical protein
MPLIESWNMLSKELLDSDLQLTLNSGGCFLISDEQAE